MSNCNKCANAGLDNKRTCEHEHSQTVSGIDPKILKVSYYAPELGCPDYEQIELIRVLAVRQPWAPLIIWGGKKFEIRTMNTNIRETIAIYASRSAPTKRDLDWLEEYGLDDIFFEDLADNADAFLKGAILGTVNLVGCQEISKDWFDHNVELHMNNPDWYKPRLFAWELIDPKPIIPIDFKFECGQVVWSRIDKGLI